MKLIIEIDVESSDFDANDIGIFTREAKEASGVNVEVSRLIPELYGGQGVFRLSALSSEYFSVRLED